MVWDNASLLHSATLIDPNDPRKLWRITIKESTLAATAVLAPTYATNAMQSRLRRASLPRPCMTPDEYRQRNDSFGSTLVFHLGIEAGFFSEINNMVLAMLYCLHCSIRFVLYSDDANFKVSRGWDDYFAPFCEETRDPAHRDFIWRFPPDVLAPADAAKVAAFKQRSGVDFLTHELWYNFRSGEFASEQIALPGREPLDLQSAAGVVIDMLWRYNAPIGTTVESLRRRVALPAEYIGLHVRAGDKDVEATPVSLDACMDKLRSHSDLRDIFLATDDHAIYEQARARYPEYRFVTTCKPWERGYVHRDFLRQDARVRQWQLLNFLAAIEILASAQCFVGSICSNPGMYLGMRMGSKRASFVDSGHWRIW